MKTKLLTLIFAMLLGYGAWGQGAATPQLAWNLANITPTAPPVPNSHWFELDIDSDGSSWISRDMNARTLPFNTGLSTLTVNPIPLNIQSSYDDQVSLSGFVTGYMVNLGTTGYEEWYVIKTPSTGNLTIKVDFAGNTFNSQVGSTIQWHEINNASQIAAISQWPNDFPGPYLKYSQEFGKHAFPIPVTYLSISSASISTKYVLLRIGNNDFASLFGLGSPAWLSSYILTVSTNNNTCNNALDFPDNAVQVDSFASTTNTGIKDLLDGSDEISQIYYDNNQVAGRTGSGITALPSNSPGEWFKITTSQDSLFFAACGTLYDAQLLIFDGCPANSGQILGAENDNLMDGSDLNWNGGTDVCFDPIDPNPPSNPVIKVHTGTTASKILYAYLFGNNASGTFEFNILRDGNDILPVDWLGFSGQPMGNINRIDWSTATETQNDYFNIEKSADGVNYETLAQIPGQGDAIYQNDYSTLDESPYYQTYYRISQVDYDGTVNTGPQTVVINDSKKVFIQLMANPVLNNEIKLRYRSDQEQEVVFFLTGTDGKAVRSQTATLIEGAAEFTIPIPNLAPGMYLLSATLNNERWVEKVVVR